MPTCQFIMCLQCKHAGKWWCIAAGHAVELAEINADMQNALHAAENQIDSLRLRLRSQRSGMAASHSTASIADSDDQQADRGGRLLCSP